MHYRVRHNTTYTYADAVSICHNELHLRPRTSPHQTCQHHDLAIRPTPSVNSESTDFFGNPVAFIAIQEPHRILAITAQSLVEVTAPEKVAATPAWDRVRDDLRRDRSESILEARQFVFDSPQIPLSPAMRHFATPYFPPGRPLLEAVAALTDAIHRTFTYDPTATSISTPLRHVLRHRRGVCQDFAHLEIACLRALGLSARYVSGYLVTQPPPGQPRLLGADASHAWVSVYCPELGWVDIDPTNNLFPAEGHITVAVGRDYSDVSPIKGVVLGGGDHTLQVAVDVTPWSEPMLSSSEETLI